MDIQQWLRETTDLEPPAPPQQLEFAAYPQRLVPEPNQDDHSYRRKRRRHGSDDSSMIAPWPSQHKKPKRHHRSRNRTPRAKEVVPSSGDYSSSQSSQLSPGGIPTKSYERRPRHKTRPDRYEPKVGKVRKERGSRRQTNSVQKPRRSRREVDGDRTFGIVQSFQLKNGPKNSRLTLKPGANGGLFKHGRASIQMAGRGKGLPDLVFNEMKFLKTPREHQDEAVEAEEQPLTDKKGRKRTHEEDISAYFTANKDAELEKADLTNKTQMRPGPSARSRDLEQPRQKDQTVPLVELPHGSAHVLDNEAANRGSRHTHNESDEYYSWSESVPEQLAPTALGQIGRQRRSQSRSDSVAHSPMIEDTREANGTHKRRTSGKGGQWIPTAREQNGALVERYEPSIAQKEGQYPNDTSVTKTTLQSLPRYPPTADKAEPHEGHVMGSSEYVHGSYRTSEILDIRDLCQNSRPEVLDRVQRRQDPVLGGKENVDPRSSFDKLLSQTRGTLTRYQPEKISSRRPERRMGEEIINVRNLRFSGIAENQQGTSHRVPFGSFDASKQTTTKLTRANAAVNERLTSRVNSLSRMATEEACLQVRRDEVPEQESRRQWHPDDDEMLDNTPEVEPLHFADRDACAPNLQHDDLIWKQLSRPALSIFDAQAAGSEETSYQNPGLLEEENASANRPSSHRPAWGGNVRSEQSVEAASETYEEFTWKPHRLY